MSVAATQFMYSGLHMRELPPTSSSLQYYVLYSTIFDISRAVRIFPEEKQLGSNPVLYSTRSRCRNEVFVFVHCYAGLAQLSVSGL